MDERRNGWEARLRFGFSLLRLYSHMPPLDIPDTLFLHTDITSAKKTEV
jgi:hypothetical protein